MRGGVYRDVEMLLGVLPHTTAIHVSLYCEIIYIYIYIYIHIYVYIYSGSGNRFRQHRTDRCSSMRKHMWQHTSAFVSMIQNTSAYVSIACGHI
jgi:hypothetical protein